MSDDDFDPGHLANDTLRVLAKAVLKDLFLEAKRLSEVAS